MTDYPTGLIGPASHVFTITPHNTDPLPVQPRAIRAGADGTITLRARDSEADVAHPVKAGEYIIAIISHIRATGTSAGTIIGYA
jgi:hypothetical protein